VTGTATGGPATGSGKYDLNKLPEDECKASDATPLFDLFEGELAKETAQRVPNAVVNTSACSYSRAHNVGKPDLVTASVTFHALGYKDLSVAVSQQDGDVATAKIAGANNPVPGLGEDAIVYETPDDNNKGSLKLDVAVRDSNLRLHVYFNGQRNDGAGWSQKQRNDVRDRLIEAAKNTLAKTTQATAR
jgi:hypothetical protein